VTCVFITGMSGTGKSTVMERLAGLGYAAYDLDEPAWSVTAEDGDWIWREDRVRALLDEHEGKLLFVSGCPSNQVVFYPRFDRIILLSAPADVLVERLRTRTTNDYGKRPEELADTLMYLETVEPRLRRVAGSEIDATLPLGRVVAEVLAVAGVRR